MTKVVRVRFRSAGKIYNFKPGDFELQVGDGVIVETARGIEYGTVVSPEREVPPDKIVAPLKPVMRRANERDEAIYRANRQREIEAMEICKQKVLEHRLPMRLVEVEYTFDMGKIIFYFTSESRVDFRELVKDLAAVFKTRIELRQIGVRDEAKMLGGIGSCGRVLCCRQFLDDFEPVSIKMATEQRLSLNPAKISGVCGRLMCCLKYESEMYEKNGEMSRYKPPEPVMITDEPFDNGQEEEKLDERRNGKNHNGAKNAEPGDDAGNRRPERKNRPAGRRSRGGNGSEQPPAE
ncbi:MAG: stage 0 sporulation family protein [Syntrophomonadaceae bacterium]|nr:stage 0 sporulation family protein [Syntrophomonadaceae bacterium]